MFRGWNPSTSFPRDISLKIFSSFICLGNGSCTNIPATIKQEIFSIYKYATLNFVDTEYQVHCEYYTGHNFSKEIKENHHIWRNLDIGIWVNRRLCLWRTKYSTSKWEILPNLYTNMNKHTCNGNKSNGQRVKQRNSMELDSLAHQPWTSGLAFSSWTLQIKSDSDTSSGMFKSNDLIPTSAQAFLFILT